MKTVTTIDNVKHYGNYIGKQILLSHHSKQPFYLVDLCLAHYSTSRIYHMTPHISIYEANFSKIKIKIFS